MIKRSRNEVGEGRAGDHEVKKRGHGGGRVRARGYIEVKAKGYIAQLNVTVPKSYLSIHRLLGFQEEDDQLAS